MTLSRLLRSVRRYSSNPYPFHSPIPTATPTNDHYPINSQYPNSSSATNHQTTTAAADTSGNYFNHQFQRAAADTSNYQYNPQNHQYNPQFSNAADTPNNHYNSQFSTSTVPETSNYNYQSSVSAEAPQSQNYNSQSSVSNPQSSTPFVPQRSYGFSSAEEAAAERRRRKRRLRIEPPMYALRSNPQTTPLNANNPDKPRLPDSTSALVGNRLNLHNRVQSLIRAGDLDSASYVVRQSIFQPVRPTVFTCNAIIAAMYRAKRYNDAKALFQYFFRQFNIIPNIVSYNNLIVSHCEFNEVDEALKVYEYIIENAPYSPSSVTYRHLTKGLIDADRIDEAVSLLHEMLNKGHGADSLVFNNVILGFLNLGKLDKANELFEELKERCTVYDGVVNATFMDWFFNQGKSKEAMDSYRDLMARNYRMVPATRNVLLGTLLRHGKKKEAWDLFHDMLDDHTPPTFQAVNSDTVNMMVNECFKEGKIDEAIEVFKRSGKGVKSKPFQMDVVGFNNMIARMCELEMMDEAEQYYKKLCDKSLSPDVNTYKTLIDAYIKMDMVDRMLEKYSKMVEVGLRVIPPYANKWFAFLIEKGKATECLAILSRMVEREPKPDVTTYDVLIRGLVEEGNYDATTNLLREMVNHGIGFLASLKEFVLDVFEKQGRRAEIESIFNNRFSNIYPPQRPYQGPRGPPTSYGNQFVEHTRQPQMNSSPQTAEQGGRNTSMPPSQQSFSSPTSYGNQFAQQTGQPQMSSPPQMADQEGRNHAMPPWQVSYSTPSNQFPEQTNQPQMTWQMSHTHPMSEQEAEFPYVARQNAA